MVHLRKSFFRAFVILLVIGLFSPNAQPVQGQGEITLEDFGTTVNFGKTITFHAKVKTALPIQQLTLLFQGADQSTHVQNVQAAEDGSVSFTYDASQNVFPPFSKIKFWFQATLSDGKVYTSEVVESPYDDTRFPWSSLTRVNVTVHWYGSDNGFATYALDMAGAGIINMQKLVTVSLTEPINIYIYSNAHDLQSTLMLGGKEWMGGHAVPELGMVLVAIPPDSDKSELETKIPHEVAHVLLYRELGRKYNLQPAWLIEGIASMQEQYANPEYKRALDIASEKDTLIPFEQLCNSFPPDTGGAYLAYAQSQSFVTYIYQAHGASGLSNLIAAYGDGLNCEMGVSKALGLSLAQLDVRWRENVLGQNVIGVAARNLSPFVLIMALVSIVPLWGMIDLMRQRRKRDEKYAEKPRIK